MRILVIDNYDSFVYNIVQILGELNIQTLVERNDRIGSSSARKMNPDGIVISPGPGHPADRRYFGNCIDIIVNIGPTTPILGVCLGHEGIVNAFGGSIINAKNIRHGKTSPIEYQSGKLFENISNPFKATRYHSLVADPNNIPFCLEVTAKALDDGEIMGVRHKQYPIEGIQFHPESVLTADGPMIFQNFISMLKK
ncbi:MAG TPA: aminodeoxychorismate/anthranilate synthase component II [Nitrososphaeraceae archaeon]|nr:aminodeoxychorismate/anthranilate synthase component II [Nitrososphaeraceae archaeon]